MRIHRESVELRAPQGISYPLLSQEEFADVFPAIYPDLRAARIASPPLEHPGTARLPCGR